MTIQHTPGQWEVISGSTGRYRAPTIEVAVMLDDGRAQTLATVCQISAGQANARLISAAPDLLAALRDLTVDAEAAGWDAPEYSDVLNAARAAIAKATGGAA